MFVIAVFVVVSTSLSPPPLDDDDLYMHDGGPDNCAFTFDDPDPIPRIVDVISDACSLSQSEHDGSECDSDYFPPPPLSMMMGSPLPPPLVIMMFCTKLTRSIAILRV